MTYDELKEQINQGNFTEVFEFLNDLYTDFSDDDKSIFNAIRKEYITGVAKNDAHFISRLKVFVGGIKKLKKTQPKSSPKKKTVSYQELIKSARVHFELNEYDKAIEIYEKVNNIKPDNYQVWFNLGIAYKKTSNLQKARKAFEKAIQIQNDDYQAWYYLGNINYAIVKPKDWAIKAYQRAVEIKPDYLEAWYSLGITYDDINKRHEARKAFRKVLEIKPDYHEAWYRIGINYNSFDPKDFTKKLNKETVLSERERANLAINAYMKALKIKPDYHEAWCKLGFTYRMIDDLNEAIEALQIAIKIRPDYIEAWLELGHCYKNINQKQEAINAFEKILGIDPNHYMAKFHLDNIKSQ